jgi:hypothetical protein
MPYGFLLRERGIHKTSFMLKSLLFMTRSTALSLHKARSPEGARRLVGKP